MHIRNEIPPKFPDNTFVSIDTEFFAMKENKLYRPHGKFALMTICAAPDFVYYITDPQEISSALKTLDNCVWVMQNAKFDITQLRQITPIPPRNKLVDTMLIERLLWNGYYDTFGLDSLVRRYLNEERPEKDYWQKWFAEHDELTEGAIFYACQDADDQLRIWNKQKEIITKTDMKIWREIDLPALWAVLDFQGFRIDAEAWTQLALSNKQKSEEIDKELPFNPRSYKQVVTYLKGCGFNDIKSSGEAELIRCMRKYPKSEAAELTQKILTAREYSTRASRYGLNFLENMVENVDGLDLVFSDWNITGAETGRMSASGGMHNIPIRDTKDFRKCFIARPGHKLVVADYAAQEARITAYLTQDKRLIEIFQQDKNPYIEIGKKIFGRDIQKGSPEYSQMKSTFLGMDYGMSEYGLAKRENISKQEAIELIERFFEILPGVRDWVENQKKLTKVTYTVSGRKAHLNYYSDQCERNALNNPHQGTAADITKKALGYINKIWDENYEDTFGVVGVYHDEIVLDVSKTITKDVQDYVMKTMVKAAEEICEGIPFKVDATICDTWAEKG